MRAVARTAVVLVALLVGSARAERTVTFPLGVDYELLAATARTALGFAGDEAVLWGTAGGCHSLVLDDVRAERAEERVRLALHGHAKVGLSFLGFCLFPIHWEGTVDARGRPEITSAWQLRLDDITTALLDRSGRTTTVSRRVWDLVRDQVETRLAAFAFDLGPPVQEAKALVRVSVPPARATPVLTALDSLRPVRATVDDDGVRVEAAMEVPDAPPPPAPEPVLDPAELQAFHGRLEHWDAFLIFVTKDLGTLDADPTARDDLLALVLTNRHELLRTIAAGPVPGVDPVRQLFLDAWEQLRTIVRRAARSGALRDHALRYVTFLAAGDALAALDAAGPGLGIEISADGLRRMARIIAPDATADPLVYSDAPDPALQKLFRFHEPESLPPAPEQSPPPEPGTWFWPGPRSAYAAVPADDELVTVGRRLDRWVPPPDQLDTYRTLVGRLLELVIAREGRDVTPRFATLYGHLVPAVAWQESCWRQFILRDGRVTSITSGTGDIGIMQVNRRVWRGFFDVEKLRWDIVYNSGAGAEILAQLLTRYGAREAGERLENAARASYSAYNGGPAAYRRYRLPRVPRTLRAIDEAFLRKYQAVAAGQAGADVLCL